MLSLCSVQKCVAFDVSVLKFKLQYFRNGRLDQNIFPSSKAVTVMVQSFLSNSSLLVYCVISDPATHTCPAETQFSHHASYLTLPHHLLTSHSLIHLPPSIYTSLFPLMLHQIVSCAYSATASSIPTCSCLLLSDKQPVFVLCFVGLPLLSFCRLVACMCDYFICLLCLDLQQIKANFYMLLSFNI